MSLYSPKPVRLHWDTDLGWLIEVPTTVNVGQVQRVIAWALPRQIDRWRSLPPGDKKDQLANAIQQLRDGKVRQRLIDKSGDGTLVPFASTERVKPTAYFAMEGEQNG